MAPAARSWMVRALPAFAVCLALRLLFLAFFGERLTAFGYEHGFGLQALALLDGRGLQVIDELVLKVDDQQFHQLPHLVQPWQYPPPPQGARAYYHATDMPGYPWILATTWRFMRQPTFWPVKFLQAIAGSLLLFPVCDIGRRLLGERTGTIAAWLFALWLPNAYLMQMASKEAWEGIFVVLTAWFALRFMQDGGKRALAMASLCLALATFMRANLMVLTGGICVVGLLCFPFRRVLLCFCVSYLFLFVCLVPWVVRNKRWIGPEVGVKEGFYWGIAGGLAMHDPALAKEVGALETRRVQPNGQPDDLFREPAEIRDLTRKVLRNRPGWFLGIVAKNALGAPFCPLDWGHDLLSPEARSLRAFHEKTGHGLFAYLARHPLAFAFKFGTRLLELAVGVMSLAVFWFRRDAWRPLLWVAACYWSFVAVYAPIHMEFRYIAPHTWALLILAAACLANRFRIRYRAPARHP
ncbi:MAG: glycosyltransferase family 39 protein [Verrucomicrobiae bacterium]|nr:glycosyltransferase family 39 protein [Verrucomicrobiae bacterium]